MRYRETIEIAPLVLVRKDGHGPVLPSRSAGGMAAAVLVELRAELLSGTTHLCESQLNGCRRPYVTRV